MVHFWQIYLGNRKIFEGKRLKGAEVISLSFNGLIVLVSRAFESDSIVVNVIYLKFW